MDASDLIAAFALVGSLLSAWISYRAYRYAVRVKEEESRIAFSREKSEFLVRINRARKLFERLEQRVKVQLSRINSAPESGRSALVGEANRLKSDLAYLEGCQRQACSLLDETYEMGQSGLAHHKPRFLRLIEEDEQFANDALARCNEIEETITKAGKSVTTFFV
ncbi:hypothetical protein PA01_13630 [Azoarcus sp. PA01]|nr:hypothetical protein PA01_13630 [Azoarcus sp. PA01]